MTPTPKTSVVLRWLRSLTIGLAVTGLLLAGGIAWLARSEGGSAWVLSQVPGLTATGTKGRLLDGPFSADRIEVKLGQQLLTVQGLAWQDATWSWRPYDGAWVGLVLAAPSAARVEFGGQSDATQGPPAPPTSLRLPLALTLQDLRIGALHIDQQAPITQIAGNITLGADGGAEHRIGALAFERDHVHAQARGSIASDAPFALELQADARSGDNTATAWQASATARGPLAQLAVQAQLGSDAARGAKLQVNAGVLPFAAWPLATMAATMSDLDLAAIGSSLPSTRLSGRAEIDTRGLDAPVAAHIELRNARPGRWDQQRLPLAALDIDLAGNLNDRSLLGIERFALQLAQGAGRIEGRGEWRAASAQLDLRLQDVRPALLDARAPAMSLSGSTRLSLAGLPALDGSTPTAPSQTLQARVALDGRLDARNALPVQISAVADAQRSGTTARIELRDVQMRSGTAHLQGSLSAELKGADWQMQSRGDLAGVDPALWFPGLGDAAWRKGPHRLAGRWQAELQAGAAMANAKTAEARLLALRGNAELSLQDSLLSGVPLQGVIKLDGNAPGWGVDADLRAAGNRAVLNGKLAPRGEDDRWRLALEAPAIAALQPVIDLDRDLATALRGPGQPPLAGQIKGNVQASGRWPVLRIESDLRASALQAAGLSAGRLQVKARAGPDSKSPLDLQLDGEQLSFDTLRADTLQLRVEGSLAEHRIAFDLQSPLRAPDWADPLIGGRASGSRIVASTKGQWLAANPRQGLLPGAWRGQALELEARDRAAGSNAATAAPWLRARDLRMQLEFDAGGNVQTASAEPGRIEALGAALRWTEAQWRAGAANTVGEARIDVQLDPLAVGPLIQKLRPAAGIGGDLKLGGHARVHIGQSVTTDVVLERAGGDLTLTDDTGTTAFGLSDLRLAIVAQDGTWHFTQAVAGSNVGVLAGAQSMRLPHEARWPRPETPMQGVLEWQVADLAAWAPFTPPGWRLSGTLRTSAALGGTFGAPEVTGEMTGSRLAARNLLLGVDVRDGDLSLSLRGEQATVNRFVFKGGTGELRLSGGAQLGAEPTARLQLEAERFQLLGRFDRRIITSGSAIMSLSKQALTLDGQFRVDEGLIDFSRGDAPSLDSDVQVRGGRAGTTTAAAAEPAEPAATTNGVAPRSTRVALQVDLGDDLKLRGRGLDTRLAGKLAISTPDGRLAVNGSVRTEAGNFAAYGQNLTIERGVVLFAGPVESPRLDIVAVRPKLDVRVGVQVSGSAQSPRVRLFSEPEMSDTDKLSWLVLGRAPDGLGRSDTALLQRAAMALLAGEGQGQDAALLSRIGLDEFSVRQTENGEVQDTVVTLGKQLSQRWYVGYERGVNSTTGTWQLVYRVAQRFTVRAQAGDDNAVDAIWTWRWN